MPGGEPLCGVLVVGRQRVELGAEEWFEGLGLDRVERGPDEEDGRPPSITVAVFLCVLRGRSRRRAFDVEVRFRGARHVDPWAFGSHEYMTVFRTRARFARGAVLWDDRADVDLRLGLGRYEVVLIVDGREAWTWPLRVAAPSPATR